MSQVPSPERFLFLLWLFYAPVPPFSVAAGCVGRMKSVNTIWVGREAGEEWFVIVAYFKIIWKAKLNHQILCSVPNLYLLNFTRRQSYQVIEHCSPFICCKTENKEKYYLPIQWKLALSSKFWNVLCFSLFSYLFSLNPLAPKLFFFNFSTPCI